MVSPDLIPYILAGVVALFVLVNSAGVVVSCLTAVAPTKYPTPSSR